MNNEVYQVVNGNNGVHGLFHSEEEAERYISQQTDTDLRVVAGEIY